MKDRVRPWLPVIGFLILFLFSAYGLYQVNKVANDAEDLAKQNREIAQAQQAQVDALEQEAAQRQAADRIILVRMCQQQQFSYRVMRGVIQADNAEARALLKRRARVLRATGVSRSELRRTIEQHKKVLKRLRPLDCEDFAGSVSVEGTPFIAVPALVILEAPRGVFAPPSGSGGTTQPPAVGGGGNGSGPPPPGSDPGPGPAPPPPVTGPGKGKSEACKKTPPGKNKHC